MMSTIKDTEEILLKKAIITLNGLGARYVILIGDAQYNSELPLEEPKKKIKRVSDPTKPKNGPYVKEALEPLQPGGMRIIIMQPGDDFDRFCSNVGAYCHHHMTPTGHKGQGSGMYYGFERDAEQKTVTVYRYK
jgi:hypothetical protein